MQDQSEEQVRLQRAYQTAVETRDSVLRERAGLQRALEEATSSVASLSDQLGRYKAIEQRLFNETQSYQSQLEALREEKSKLAKVGYTAISPSLAVTLCPCLQYASFECIQLSP